MMTKRQQEKRLCGTVAAIGIAMFATAVTARQGDPEAAKIKNPVPTSAASIAAGQKAFTEMGCGTCHGPSGEGGMLVSITEDRGLPPPPELNDDTWTRGGTDGEIFSTIKKGVPPEYIMGPYDGRLPDADIWNVVNYLRSLNQKK
jgi:mono/diheme cytochrome c family protein